MTVDFRATRDAAAYPAPDHDVTLGAIAVFWEPPTGSGD